jgi:hypothetical protein
VTVRLIVGTNVFLPGRFTEQDDVKEKRGTYIFAKI